MRNANDPALAAILAVPHYFMITTPIDRNGVSDALTCFEADTLQDAYRVAKGRPMVVIALDRNEAGQLPSFIL